MEYNFTNDGLNSMYEDSITTILDTIQGEETGFTINDLNIKITIGDKETEIPIHADGFEMLFECLHDILDNMEG